MKKVAVIFLINSKNELLLQLRDNKPFIPCPGYWSLIGGSVEENESELQAIKRETKEEIGFELKEVKFLEKVKALEKVKVKKGNSYIEDVELSFFKSNINFLLEEVILGEGQKVKFFSFEECNNLKIPKTIKDFLIENQDIIFQ